MNVAVLGSGGREHAIVWKLHKESKIKNLYCIPGNAGTSKLAKNVALSLNDHFLILKFVEDNDVDLTIVGPEGPLVEGIVDLWKLRRKPIFGPTKAAAMLESSKIYARNIMHKYDIPHPFFVACSTEEQVDNVKHKIGLPLVMKDDGLASGKGVLICQTKDDYEKAKTHFFHKTPFKRISVEECLQGPELSVFIVCNGTNYIILNHAQDYKRLKNGGRGPNTGGMGAYTPVSWYDNELEDKIKTRIIEPTLNAIKTEGAPYCGFLYFGLMLVHREPYVIEYNVRLGDPETQVLMPMMETSLLDIIQCTLNDTLISCNYRVKPGYCTAVMTVEDGYPRKYQTGHPIHGLSEASLCFHSGTTTDDVGNVITSGGRVLSTIGMGSTMELSVKNAYQVVNQIRFHKMYYRTDIGKVLPKKQIYEGKVRTVETIGNDLLLLTASNRLSAFNQYICDIPNKGKVLNNLSKWWFERTKHIIENHFLFAYNEHMIVKRTDPIKIEFVVRGYMTGSTKTSIWTMYKEGHRDMYGMTFREGYEKNDKLDSIILTPTTKDRDDIPINKGDILSKGYLNLEEYNFIEEKSKALFEFGQKIAHERGLILVDTKYEFGRLNGDIILIDELHTCDSSRYWIERNRSAREPCKHDKDVIRDWVKSHCDPYKDAIPHVPSELINMVDKIYSTYNELF